MFPDPNAPGTSAQVFVDRGSFDSNVTATAFSFTSPVRDRTSLDELRESIRGRSRRGIAELRAEHDRLHLDSPRSSEQIMQAMQVRWSIAYLYMYEGKLAEATDWIDRALELSRLPGVPPEVRGNLVVLRGICALRQGEVENCLECLGPSSCIFPIAPEAAHRNQAGSREAIRQFTAYLDETPGDLQVRWLLNLAYMTLGEYPDKVPPRYLIRLDNFRSKLDVGKFTNIAARAGLGVRGPNLAGAACLTTSPATIFRTFSQPHSTST